MNQDDDVDLITRILALLLAVFISIPLADYIAQWWLKLLGWEL